MIGRGFIRTFDTLVGRLGGMNISKQLLLECSLPGPSLFFNDCYMFFERAVFMIAIGSTI